AGIRRHDVVGSEPDRGPRTTWGGEDSCAGAALFVGNALHPTAIGIALGLAVGGHGKTCGAALVGERWFRSQEAPPCLSSLRHLIDRRRPPAPANKIDVATYLSGWFDSRAGHHRFLRTSRAVGVK